MKKTNLIGGLFSALLLVSPLVSADDEYPAYDFEPTILYQDESVIAAAAAAPAAVTATSASESTSTSAASGGDLTLLIGILLLAGIMGVAYIKSGVAAPKKKAGGSTGVSRYLEEQADRAPAVSGVEKYLQERG